MRRACFVIRSMAARAARRADHRGTWHRRRPGSHQGCRDSEVAAHALNFGRQTSGVRIANKSTHRTSVANS
jgi:hypothetical protein